MYEYIRRKFVIWSYEHNGWWGPNHRGYTTDLRKAGHYTMKEAWDILEKANITGEINEDMIGVDKFIGLKVKKEDEEQTD